MAPKLTPVNAYCINVCQTGHVVLSVFRSLHHEWTSSADTDTISTLDFACISYDVCFFVIYLYIQSLNNLFMINKIFF